jgi:hypothetical protein
MALTALRVKNAKPGPGGWQAIADAAEMRRDNREAIDACDLAATKVKQPVRCVIRIRVRIDDRS